MVAIGPYSYCFIVKGKEDETQCKKVPYKCMPNKENLKVCDYIDFASVVPVIF